MAGKFAPLSESEVAGDPFVQFEAWYRDAEVAVRMPEAVALATTSTDLRPSVRMVLARSWDQSGFVFYTDYRSRKSSEIEANPNGAMLFYWDVLGRQVRIEGTIARISETESDLYFSKRPRGSRVAAHTSVQSRPIDSRDALEARFRELWEGFEGEKVPRPRWWGGFRLTPDRMEFWQQGDDRLHDRILFTREESGWSIGRLQP